MGLVTAKSLVFLQLSALLLSSFTAVLAVVYDDEIELLGWSTLSPHSLPTFPPVSAPKPHHHHHHHHHNHHSPSPAPVKPPNQPAPAPAQPPRAKPPKYPVMRKLFAVQGVVYCKSCKYPGIDTLLGATPLVGAVVKVQCNNTKYRPVEAKGSTDKNGYFLIMPKNVTTAASHKCKVYLVSSPVTKCSVPTNLHAGSTGAILMPTRKPPVAAPSPTPQPKFEIFTVGPFAFQPSKSVPCPLVFN